VPPRRGIRRCGPALIEVLDEPAVEHHGARRGAPRAWHTKRSGYADVYF
jgi:hypothetical protein